MFVIGLIIGLIIGLSVGCIIFAVIVSKHNIGKEIYENISEIYCKETADNQ